MKSWGSLLLVCALMVGCSEGSSVECESSADCTGDPGENCRWQCKDNECEAVCDTECQTAEDCEGKQWTLECPGVWECNDGECQEVCTGCTSVADCLEEVWELQCVGHWTCDAWECVGVCDQLNCGDGVCDSSIGETAETCYEDCTTDCVVAADCLSLQWGEDCHGNWVCEGGQCLESCNAITCPDGTCDPDLGESGLSCPDDCDMSCITALDCHDHLWPLECEGHWECRRGQCEAVCGQLNPCQESIDCLEFTWFAGCMGHWACEHNVCQVVCGDTCGDDVCSPEGGESEDTCEVDCRIEPECQQPSDCLDLPWLSLCSGHWDCEQGECQEICEYDTCGDGACDEQGGESAASCPLDCVVDCVEEGFPVWGDQECCPGLDRIQEILPDDIGPNPDWFCLDCGDMVCGAHESPYNCMDDCPDGCKNDEVISYDCDNGQSVIWCDCKQPECVPECRYEGTYSEGWYDSCTGEMIGDFTICANCVAICQYPGSDSEGWYSACDSTQEPVLINWAFCSPYWSCLYDPTEHCR